MIVSEEIKYEVQYGKKASRFAGFKDALDYFNEKASENKRPRLYKRTQKVELERFNIGVITAVAQGNQELL
jgi:hypothetical protein